MKKYRKVLFSTVLISIGILILGIGCSFSSPSADAASTADKLNGKTVLIQGGSVAKGAYITKGNSTPTYSFGDYLSNEYHMAVTNVAVPGAAWYDKNNENIIPPQTANYRSTSYDYIFIHPSSNDVKKHGGKLTKSYNALLDYLDTITKNSKWSSSRIAAIITPHPDYDRSGLGEKDFEKWIELFKKACKKYSIPIVDFGSDNSMTIKGEKGSYDGKHPSQTLQTEIGKKLAKEMPSLPKYKYKVEFDLNGLSTENDIKSQKIVHGKTATEPKKPKVKNSKQKFKYWSTEKNGAAFNFSTAINKKTILYAVYEGGESSNNGDNSNSSDNSNNSSNDSDDDSDDDSSSSGGSGSTTNNNGKLTSKDPMCGSGVPEWARTSSGCDADSANALPQATQDIIKVVVAVCGIIATIFIIVGGVNYMTSGGDSGKAKKAKDTILYSVIGLVFCALTFIIVNWIIGSVLGQ